MNRWIINNFNRCIKKIRFKEKLLKKININRIKNIRVKNMRKVKKV